MTDRLGAALAGLATVAAMAVLAVGTAPNGGAGLDAIGVVVQANR